MFTIGIYLSALLFVLCFVLYRLFNWIWSLTSCLILDIYNIFCFWSRPLLLSSNLKFTYSGFLCYSTNRIV